LSRTTYKLITIFAKHFQTIGVDTLIKYVCNLMRYDFGGVFNKYFCLLLQSRINIIIFLKCYKIKTKVKLMIANR